MDINLQDTIVTLGNSFEEFKGYYDKRIDALETVLARQNLGYPGGGSSLTGDTAGDPEYDKAFYNWARSGSNEDRLKSLSPRGDLSTSSDPDGGYLVPTVIDREVDRLSVDSVAMRRIARVKSGIRGIYQRPMSMGGAGCGWVGELETRAETATPQLASFEPPIAEIYALPKVSQATLDNGMDIETWLGDEILNAETELEGRAFILGSGVKMPKGILSYDTIANASWTWGNVGYIASGEATAFTNADKLIELQHALKSVYRRNACWLMNDYTLEHVRKFKDGEGRYIWRAGLETGAADTLLGKPIEIDDNMPDIAADSFPIAFGDFKRGYMIGDHAVGRRLLRDPYSVKGQILYYATKKLFGGIYNFESIKLLKIAVS